MLIDIYKIINGEYYTSVIVEQIEIKNSERPF